MKENYTDITIILDRSGSMGAVVADTVGGFNTLIEGRKKDAGETKISLVQFDDQYERVFEAKSPDEIGVLEFEPRGLTALYDAIGRTVLDVGNRLRELSEEERPDKVLIVVITDGQENSSREFTSDKINEMITHQQDVYNWDFMFIGANQDAILSAQTIGISASHSMNYCCNSVGTKSLYQSVDTLIRGYSCSGNLDTSDANKEQEDLIKGVN